MAPSCSRDNYLGLLLNYLCAESLVATVDDALEWFVSAVIGHVLLQPGLGGRALAEDLAALPVALELDRSLVTPPLPVTYGMNNLKLIFRYSYTVKLGHNEHGYSEQNFQSQITIHYINQPGYNEPKL